MPSIFIWDSDPIFGVIYGVQKPKGSIPQISLGWLTRDLCHLLKLGRYNIRNINVSLMLSRGRLKIHKEKLILSMLMNI
jgi:hypothetical protein